MAIATGDRLGPYEILTPLGAGGMGEVWKARDTRLDRIVAIKTVSGPFSDRFEREARAISALNHPHICALYDVGEHDGAGYLVMEYVEGATLKGPLPLDQALKYAAQICDALDAAHRKGIVHRDLKPDNILLTKSGVKLLDFGLAKLTAPPAAAGATGSASGVRREAEIAATKALTGEHVILGTPQYMAPEQIEGRDADARTDVFAFGCVLYELLTGQKAFDGKTPSSTMAAILATEPRPMRELQPITPPAVERVVQRCLAKDPDDRWQTARDLRAELDWIASSSGQVAAATPVTAHRTARMPWLLAWAFGVIAVVSAAVTLTRWSTPPTPLPTLQATLLPPDGTTFDYSSAPALSPDGRWLAFSARGESGASQLWIRRMDSPAAQPLRGTDAGYYPFWSYDSRYLAYGVGNTLKKIDIAGGPPVTIAELGSPMRGGSWNQDNVILVGVNSEGAILRVSAGGGATSPATTVDPAKERFGHRLPWFLPDGRHFLYNSFNPIRAEQNLLCVGSLDDPKTARFIGVQIDRNATFAQGQLLYVRETVLMAQPFDVGRLVTTGDAISLAERVPPSSYPQGSPNVFTASTAGLLVYLTRREQSSPSKLVWVDRSGKVLDTLATTERANGLALSPDRKSLAVSLSTGRNIDVWIYDLARKDRTKFTFDPALDVQPRWSRDGQWIFWQSDRPTFSVLRKRADGGGAEETLYRSPSNELALFLSDVSPDGSVLLFYNRGPFGSTWEVSLQTTPQDRKATPYLTNPSFAHFNARFSPDGRWISYTSNETGQAEVYVAQFPALGGKRLVSIGGGYDSRWRADGNELYYTTRLGDLMAVRFTAHEGVIDPATPQKLFGGLPVRDALYDASMDGQQFIVGQEDEASALAPALTVTQNWTAALRK